LSPAAPPFTESCRDGRDVFVRRSMTEWTPATSTTWSAAAPRMKTLTMKFDVGTTRYSTFSVAVL
jgi:hypothetical protein